jgi:hypothetical protein
VEGILTIKGFGPAEYDEEYEPPFLTLRSVIDTIIVEENITTIGMNFLSDLGSIRAVYLPSTLTEIEESAFENDDISEIFFAGQYSPKVDDSAFSNETLNIKVNVGTPYFSSSFGGLEINVNYQIPQNGTIGSFEYYIVNDTLIIQSIGDDKLFPNHPRPLFIYHSDKINHIKFDVNLTRIGEYMFASLTKLNRINLPDSINYIGSFSFYNSSIEYLEIPENVRHIGNHAFANCSNLETLKLMIKTDVGLYTPGENIFGGDIPSNLDIEFPDDFVFAQNGKFCGLDLPSTTNNPSGDDDEDKLSPGEIAAIVIACVALVAIIISCVVYCIKCRKPKKENVDLEDIQ